MGMRLHYAVHYAPQWEGGYFNWDMDKWENLFYAKFYENGWKEENADVYEINRDDVKAYIEELKKLDGKAKNEFFPDDKDEPESGYTNEQIIHVLEEILLSEDDNIRLEWF